MATSARDQGAAAAAGDSPPCRRRVQSHGRRPAGAHPSLAAALVLLVLTAASGGGCIAADAASIRTGRSGEPPPPRRIADLPDGLYYNPLATLTREDIVDDHVLQLRAERAARLLQHPARGRLAATLAAVQRRLFRATHDLPPRMSDHDLLRAMGLYSPAHPSALSTAARQADADLDPRLSGSPGATVRGSKSTIQVWYSPNFPARARLAYENALRTWSNTFGSPAPIRFSARWVSLDGRTLAATAIPVLISGNESTTGRLNSNTFYFPTLAEAIDGTTLLPPQYAHVVHVFDSLTPWNTDVSANAGRSEIDLPTVALHEQCHGLFFGGQILADPSVQQAVVDPQTAQPVRFDRFLATSAGDGILQSCPSPQSLYGSLTSGDLLYLDVKAAAGTRFSLYAPAKYQSGSSTYHLDESRLYADCSAVGISDADCSDLMTYQLPPGYTQRAIGTNTRRILNSQLGSAPGVSTSSCSAQDSDVSGASGNGPIFDPTDRGGSGKSGSSLALPVWAIAVIASIGGLVLLMSIVLIGKRLFAR